MASLGSLVVKLVMEQVGKYKADLNDAASSTEAATARIEKANAKAGAATSGLGEKINAVKQVAGAAEGDLAGAARGATTLASGAGVAAVSVGVLVAGLAATAFAAHQGAQEQKAYDQALILTGNVAGTNASQMQAMAAGIDKVVGTQYEGAAALTAMAASGMVAGRNLQKFSELAVDMERTVGAKVGDTVKQFAELGQEPVRASLKLNETMNYLTASTFEQIKAAQDLGDKEAAASLAQNAFADAMKTRTAQIKANLGTLERAWMGVRDFAKEAWDSMLGIGRKAGPEQGLELAKKAVDDLESRLGKSAPWERGEVKIRLDAARQQLSLAQETAKMSERASQSQAESAAFEKAKITWIQGGEKYLDKEAKTRLEIAKIRQEGVAAGKDEKDIQARITAEIERGAAKGGGATRIKIDENEKLIASVREGLAASQAELELGQKLTPVQKEIATLYEKISVSKVKYKLETLLTVDALMQEKLANEAANLTRVAGQKATEEANKERQKTLNSLANEAGSLEEQIRKQRDHNEGIGKSKSAISALTAQRELDIASTLEAIAIKKLDRNLDYELYDAQMKIVKGMRERAALTVQGGAKEAGLEDEKKAVEEFKGIWQSVDQTAHDVFVSIEQGGSNLWNKLKNTAKSVFFDFMYQMTLKKWLFSAAVSVTGTSESVAQKVMGGQGGGGALGMASNFSSLMGLSDGGGLLGMFSGTGMFAGSALTTSIGSLAGSITGLTAANTALGVELGLGAASSAAAASTAAAAGGTSTLMAGLSTVPVYGWIAAAAVAAFMIFSDDSIPSVSNGGTTRTYGADGKVSNETVGQWGLGNAGGMTDSMAIQFAAVQQALMSKGGSTFAFGSHTGDNNENPEFRLSGGTGDKVYDSGLVAANPENMAREASRAVLAALQSSEMPVSVAKFFDGLIPAKMSSEQIDEAVKAAAGFITQVNAMGPALDLLPLENLKNLSFDAAAGLVQAAGGFENLNSGLSSYLDNFVSDGEKRATKFRQITATLNAAGAHLTTAQVMGASRRDFSDYRSAIDVTTKEGQKLFATLLSVAGAFAELTPELMSVADITSGLPQIIVDGMQSGDAAGAGQLFAETLIYGVQDALYQGFAEQVTSMISDQLVSPLVTALVTGASINEAVSEASIATMVAQATAAAQALNALMTDSTFQSALGQISAAVSGAVSGSIRIAGAGYRPVSAPSRGSYSSGSSGSSGGGGAGSAGDRIKDEWRSICDSLIDEMKRVRGEIAGDGPQGVAYAQNAFAIATDQARAGDQDAAKSLPQLNRAYLELVNSNAGSALELRRAQAAQLASLEATNSLLAQKYGVAVPAFATGGYHGGGWAMGGENGPELANFSDPARIYNASDTRAMRSGGSSDGSTSNRAETAAALNVVVNRLDAIEANTRAGAQHGGKLAWLLERIMPKRDAINVRVLA